MLSLTGPAPSGATGQPTPLQTGLPDLAPLPTIGERIMVDGKSGVAIGGFDPVAYFAEGRPIGGSARHEWTWRSVVWRFASAANLAAFLEAPEVYAPLFGGHDPMAVMRGQAVDGDPGIHALVAGRLILFRTQQDRTAFLARPEALGAAQAAWPRLEAQLVH